MSTITLAELSALAAALIAADRAVDNAELALSEAKAKAQRLREEAVPMAMMELEITEFKMVTGEKITVKQDVFAQLSNENKPLAYAWLERHNFGGLIKTDLNVEFGRGELDSAKTLAAELLKKGLVPTLTQSVHAQTLKAFLREQMEAGNKDLPLETFGARAVWVAKAVQPK